MKYIIEKDGLFRITDDNNKEQLLFVIDNGRMDAIVAEIKPIKENWLNECKKFGIINHTGKNVFPFWNNEKDRLKTLKLAQAKFDYIKKESYTAFKKEIATTFFGEPDNENIIRKLLHCYSEYKNSK